MAGDLQTIKHEEELTREKISRILHLFFIEHDNAEEVSRELRIPEPIIDAIITDSLIGDDLRKYEGRHYLVKKNDDDKRTKLPLPNPTRTRQRPQNNKRNRQKKKLVARQTKNKIRRCKNTARTMGPKTIIQSRNKTRKRG